MHWKRALGRARQGFDSPGNTRFYDGEVNYRVGYVVHEISERNGDHIRNHLHEFRVIEASFPRFI
jgi:hypothetical protein